MGRKRLTSFPVAGRPPKDPLQKVGYHIRALVTIPVMNAVEQSAELSGINLSDMLRLTIYRYLDNQDMITPELAKDPTWESLREKGLV